MLDTLRFVKSFFFNQPDSLIIFVTDRCNMKCKHCLLKYFKSSKSLGELTLEEYNKFFYSLPVINNIHITGGEPFLRNDFLEILNSVVKHGKARNLTIVTNGWYTGKIISIVKKLVHNKIGSITIKISLDGPEKIHDSIRQTSEAFSRALTTISELKKIAKDSKKLKIGTITTFQRANQAHLMGFLNTLKELKVDTISLNLIRGISGEDNLEEKLVDEYRNTYRAYVGSNSSKFRRAYKELVYDYQIRNISSKCKAGKLLAVLGSKGDVFACELLDVKMGNIVDNGFDFNLIWKSSKAKDLRTYINKKCNYCSYECVIPYNIVCSPSLLIKLAMRFFLK